MITITIHYSEKRGGFYFVTKEHGDCLYFPTLHAAQWGVMDSWGNDVSINTSYRADRANLEQQRALKVAS